MNLSCYFNDTLLYACKSDVVLKDAAAKAIVELERKIRELTLQIQNGGPGGVVENKNGANHEDSTNQLNVTCDTVRNVRGNDVVERDDIRNVRMCDQTTTVISAAETARHAGTSVFICRRISIESVRVSDIG